jgi:hypothetical protein
VTWLCPNVFSPSIFPDIPSASSCLSISSYSSVTLCGLQFSSVSFPYSSQYYCNYNQTNTQGSVILTNMKTNALTTVSHCSFVNNSLSPGLVVSLPSNGTATPSLVNLTNIDITNNMCGGVQVCSFSVSLLFSLIVFLSVLCC